MRAIRIVLGTPDLPVRTDHFHSGLRRFLGMQCVRPVGACHTLPRSPMPAEHSTLGVCPVCERAIPPTQLLIEYETADGTRIYAECPECRDVVHPE